MSTEEVTDPKKTWVSKIHDLVQNVYLHHALIVAVIVFGSLILLGAMSDVVDTQIQELGVMHDPTAEKFDCVSACKALPNMNEQACARIGTQAEEIEGRIAFYYDAMKYYTSMQFAFVFCGYTLGIVSAMLGVAVSRDGWGDCDKRLLTAFGAAAAMTAFFEGFPALVKFQSNVNQNSDTFLYYDDLFDEVETFCTIGVSKEGVTDSSMFIQHVDSRIAELNELYFEVDETQMTSGGKKFIESQNMDQYKADSKKEETPPTPTAP